MLAVMQLAVWHNGEHPALMTKPLEIMEHWNKIVTLPSLFLVWVLGMWLALETRAFAETWMQAKLVFVISLSGLHATLTGRLRRADESTSKLNNCWPIFLNVGLVTALCAIAVMVIVKPNYS